MEEEIKNDVIEEVEGENVNKLVEEKIKDNKDILYFIWILVGILVGFITNFYIGIICIIIAIVGYWIVYLNKNKISKHL